MKVFKQIKISLVVLLGVLIGAQSVLASVENVDNFSKEKIKLNHLDHLPAEETLEKRTEFFEEFNNMPEADKTIVVEKTHPDDFGRMVENGGHSVSDEILDDIQLEPLANDTAQEAAEMGLSFWKRFERNIALKLRNIYPNARVGDQVYLDVHYLENGVQKVITVIPDNLIQLDVGGIRKYKVIDAKSSKTKDLVKMEDLTSTLTTNQKIAYRLFDGESIPGITLQKVEMKGQHAIRAFRDEFVQGIDRKVINVDQGVQYFVNKSNIDPLQFETRSRIL